MATVSDGAWPAPAVIRHHLGRLDRLLHGWRLILAVATAYLIYAIFVTWPLATNLSGQLAAPNFLEDAAGAAALFGDLTANHLSPFLPGHVTLLNAPQSLPVSWALNLAQAPSFLLYWLFALGFGTIAGLNLFVLSGFVASGTVMFAATYRLFGSRAAACLAGFAFAFYPFAVSAAFVHYAFVHGWPMVLCVWGIIEMVHRPSRRTAWIAGFATTFAMWWNPYYELFGGFAFATGIVVCLLLARARGQTRQAIKTSALATLPLIGLAGFFVILLKLSGGAAGANIPARPISQVYSFSAHLREYLLPGPYSMFGRLTGNFLESRAGIAPTWDSALYPGFVVVLLAIAGLLRTVRSVRTTRFRLAELPTVAVFTGFAIAVVGFLASAPPTVSIGPLRIEFPSGIIYHFAATWQTYSRFIILVEAALVIVMAAEIAHIRRRLPDRQVGLVMALIGLLLAADLWTRQPIRTAPVTPSAAYAWLKAHPGGTVADYPVLPVYDPAASSAIFWGWVDQHPSLEGYALLSPDESLKLNLADLAAPQTAGKLAADGVRYIVVHPGTPGGDPRELRRQGYRPIIVGRPGGNLWGVISRPASTSVDPEAGFSWSYGFPAYDDRLLDGSGSVQLTARACSSCVGILSFTVHGAGRAVRLTVSQGGATTTLASVRVPARGTLTLHIAAALRRGAETVTLKTTPAGRPLVFDERTAQLSLRS